VTGAKIYHFEPREKERKNTVKGKAPENKGQGGEGERRPLGQDEESRAERACPKRPLRPSSFQNGAPSFLDDDQPMNQPPLGCRYAQEFKPERWPVVISTPPVPAVEWRVRDVRTRKRAGAAGQRPPEAETGRGEPRIGRTGAGRLAAGEWPVEDGRHDERRRTASRTGEIRTPSGRSSAMDACARARAHCCRTGMRRCCLRCVLGSAPGLQCSPAGEEGVGTWRGAGECGGLTASVVSARHRGRHSARRCRRGRGGGRRHTTAVAQDTVRGLA